VVLAVSSAAVRFSIAGLPVAPADTPVPADLDPVWVVPDSSLVAAAPCTQPVLRPAVLVDPARVREWVRVLALGNGPSVSVQAWVVLDWLRRLPVKRRVRHVPARAAAAVRVTRRPKKAR
jgi:hypothetical protein